MNVRRFSGAVSLSPSEASAKSYLFLIDSSFDANFFTKVRDAKEVNPESGF